MAETSLPMFETIINPKNLDALDLDRAKSIFEEYKKKKIILTENFEDNHWHFTDEYSNLSIRFKIPEIPYRTYYYPVWQLSAQKFIDYIKYYIVMYLGKLVLETLRTFTYDLNTLLSIDPFQPFDSNNAIFIHRPWSLIEFFSLLPEPYDQEKSDEILAFLDALSEYHHTQNIKNNQRSLATFDSYFLFNDIMKDYWHSVLSREERLFYYPLYLWWEITAVIPMRPREFILTPRKCLSEYDGKYYLLLRKNKLKGSGKSVSYHISEDYRTVTYQIPKKLAEQISDYMDFTKEYEDTDLGTLFVSDPHYQKWNQKKHCNSRFFTYVNMNCVMRYFYEEIIQGRYGLSILYEKTQKHLPEGCIEYIHLGDTRHIALINLIAEGGTPMLAMMLAGHDSIETAAHYYSNITTLIECRTYKQYRKVLNGDVSYSVSLGGQITYFAGDDYVSLENNGRCFFSGLKKGDYSQCRNISGPNGEIGYCPKCPYYRNSSDAADFFKGDDLYKRRLEENCKELEQVIRTVRQHKGNTEDILEVILKLENSSYEYEQYLKEKKMKENDDKWQENQN